MNKLNIMLIAASTLALTACSQVQPGHVGIKVNEYGSDAGVQPQSLGVGTYYAGPGTSIYEYPIYTSTYTWTASNTEGNKTNEEISFADKNGLVVTADVAVSYHVDASKAPVLFQKYRTDMQGIVDGPMRVAIRNAITNEASNMTVEEIYGPRKSELINKSLVDVQRYFSQYGLDIEQLYWASPVRIPEAVMHQINQKIANENQALAAQANVATAEADARARIAKAEGEAKATQIEAEALRTNPAILQQKWIDKWNGQLPTYVAGPSNGMMLNMNKN